MKWVIAALCSLAFLVAFAFAYVHVQRERYINGPTFSGPNVPPPTPVTDLRNVQRVGFGESKPWLIRTVMPDGSTLQFGQWDTREQCEAAIKKTEERNHSYGSECYSTELPKK